MSDADARRRLAEAALGSRCPREGRHRRRHGRLRARAARSSWFGRRRRDRLPRRGARTGEGERVRRARGAANEEAVRGVDLVVLATSRGRDSRPPAPSPARSARRRAQRRERSALRPTRASLGRSGRRRSRRARSLPVPLARRRVLAHGRPTRTPSSAATTGRRSSCSSSPRVVAGRALDAGPLASARALEGLTAVIVT